MCEDLIEPTWMLVSPSTKFAHLEQAMRIILLGVDFLGDAGHYEVLSFDYGVKLSGQSSQPHSRKTLRRSAATFMKQQRRNGVTPDAIIDELERAWILLRYRRPARSPITSTRCLTYNPPPGRVATTRCPSDLHNGLKAIIKDSTLWS